MVALDCESFDTALTSVANIMGLSRAAIVNVLAANNFSDECEHMPDNEMAQWNTVGAYILYRLSNEFQLTPAQIDQVYWFHLARTLHPYSYKKDGIIPLGAIHDQLFNEIYALVQAELSREEWDSIISSNDSFLYGLKMGNSLHWGPFAMLVKDVAYSAREIGNHDYLEIPEIVEDISRVVMEQYGIDLAARYQAASTSVIVKFSAAPDRTQSSFLSTVLYYLYTKIHKAPLSIYCNDCFDARNSAVSPGCIEYVEVCNQQK